MLKKTLIMVACLAFVVSLIPISFSAADEEKITIVWMDDRTNEDGEYLRRKYVIEPFLAAHPNVEVDWQPTIDITKAVKIALAGGAGPDLMSIDGPSDALELYASGRTIALNDAIEKYGWDKYIYPWALDVSTDKDGNITGVPAQFEGMLFYGNKEVFEEHGWTMPTTYAELKTLAAEIREAGFVAPMILGTQGIPRRNEWWYSTLFANYAGREATKDLLEGRKTFFDPEISGVFTTYKEMWDEGIIGNQDTFSVTLEDGRAMYFSGMTAMAMEGDWFVTTGINNDFSQLIALPPSFREGVPQSYSLAVGGCYAVNSACSEEKRELIFELLDYMLGRPDLYVASVEEGEQVNCLYLDESYLTGKLNPYIEEKIRLVDDACTRGDIGHTTWTFFPQDVRLYMYEKADSFLMGELALNDYLAEMQRMLDIHLADGTVPPVM